MWQIAQRDYKFGKGKHSSLTKATYDAVGDKFRSLWGKEAGWAHSVLFTADLRAFSKQQISKIEVQEIKSEGDSSIAINSEVQTDVLIPLNVKRKIEEDQKSPIAVTKVAARQVKRRRKG